MTQQHVYVAAIAAVLFSTCLLTPSRAAGPKSTAEPPDFTRGDRIPQGWTHDWNLGPTGARGWIYSNKMETSEATQVYVTQVDPASPSDGVLRVGDVILGVAGERFTHDPRTELGRAITKAEATDGALALLSWRDGTETQCVVKLPVLGSYSDTAPFDCSKSNRIFEQGCEALASQLRENPNAGNGITRSLNALALLSSGNPEYLPLVREQVRWASQYSDPERRSLHSWFYGPINMLLAEYLIATGDRDFFPDMQRITMEIVRGQSAVGSWGHRFVQPGGRLSGYGMMNAPGLPLTASLIMARKAGVDHPELDQAIEKSARLIRFYVGKGSVPYGDHHPWLQTHDDNGKNGIAAVMFNLIRDATATEYFSRMSVASYGAERDTGHTGNFFNMLWAMPGVAMSGPHASGRWMNEFGWYYDLARRSDGTFRHQGPPAARADKYGGWDCTGAYLLAYAQPGRHILLTGKQSSVAPQVDLTAAIALIEDGRDWSPRNKQAPYANRDTTKLIAGLNSWSPVVRERSASELAKRDGDPVPQLIKMLQHGDLNQQLGACQALTMLRQRASTAVPVLTRTLAAEDLWLQVKAAEALANIGEAAMPAVPTMLTMLAAEPPQSDTRGMLQRYLLFALFNKRGGMLGRSLEGVDREALHAAVRAGLQNQDGRARGAISTVYQNLEYEEIKPLLPSIYGAVVHPAPSGIMFADGIRLSGLEILAQHRVEEGVDLCIDLMDIDRWGKKDRITKCLNALQQYGGSAQSVIPKLEQIGRQLAVHKEAKGLKPQIELLRQTVRIIQSDKKESKLRPLETDRW